VSLITTPGASDANAYCSLARAEEVLVDSRLHAESTWQGLTVDDQERAIRWATQIVDQAWDWDGSPTNYDQTLRWPRAGLVNLDGVYVDQDTIPPLIERLTAEMAFYLAQADRTADPTLLGLGFRKAKVGSLEVELDEGQLKNLVPSYLVNMASPLGRLLPSANPRGGGSVRIRRG
jgi:hypothetical protein